MSFIYSLISKGDSVLCEYTDFKGNFQQITRIILQKGIKQNSKYIMTNIQFIT